MTVTVLDDGLEWKHSDLRRNYVSQHIRQQSLDSWDGGFLLQGGA